MHRDRQLDAGLFLPDLQHAVADVLAAEMHNVGTPLAGIDQQAERQPCGRAYRVPRLELRNLGFGP